MCNYGNCAHAFGKGHMHLCAQQLKYNPQDFLIWFFSLSLLCSYAHCLYKLERYSRHKDYEVIIYSQAQTWRVEIQHYELTCP